MQVCRTISDIRAHVGQFKADGESVALVPTMGFLHAGHIALVNRAKAECKRCVVTIFVNPTQFGDARDLEAYPRDEARDLEMLREAGVDAVLIPPVSEIYPPGDETIVETTHLANILHGKVRPGHFRGVTTVVARLFNIVGPDRAFFGEKDWQQLQVIRRMVRDLHMPLEIVGVPTIREDDGLAMSSRNVRLSPKDRKAARVLSQSLDTAEKSARDGAGIPEIGNDIRAVINTEPRARLRAVDIVWRDTLEPASGPLTRPIAIMLSAEFGDILLIDQREIFP